MVTLRKVFTILLIWSCSEVNSWVEVYDQDMYLSLNDYVQKLGFDGIESYTKITSDGYILDIYRIKRDGANELMPILFVHGLTSCADTFFIPKNLSAPIKFARNGFDVWLMNARGTANSLGHTKWNSSTDKEYWMFSWQEIGLIDLPTTIDTVLEHNIHEKVIIIGYSEGTTVVFVTLSDVPEYNKKVALSIQWGVSVYHEGCTPIPLLRILCTWSKLLPWLSETFGIWSLHPSYNIKEVIVDICRYEIFKSLCKEGAKLFTQNDERIEHIDDWSFTLSKAMCGGSIREVIHFTQLSNSGRFARFDYGPSKNLVIYNSTEPPLFHLENIDSPVALWCGGRDIFCTKNDLDKLISQLSNVVSTSFKGMSEWAHMDFLMAKHIEEEMYDDMLKIMRKYST